MANLPTAERKATATRSRGPTALAGRMSLEQKAMIDRKADAVLDKREAKGPLKGKAAARDMAYDRTETKRK